MTSKDRHELRYQRRKARREQKKKSKQIGQSFEEVFSYKHLYKSHRLCRKTVTWKASVQKYVVQAPVLVYRTWKRLMKGTFRSYGFFEFDIFERGKARHIRSVTMGERVVQRCLCDNSLVPMLGRTFIYDNGASMTDKGYHFAFNRIVRHLQWHHRHYGTDGYVLLFDFSKFFDNVSHAIIRQLLAKEVPDQRVRKLAEYFMDCFGDVGMGLGSQISQVFALASANRLDHYIKEVLRIHCYGRYMDDGYLIHHSKEYLHKCLEKIKELCKELDIKLNLKKTQIVKISHGFTYLKARLFLLPTGKVVRKIYKRSVCKMRQKLKKFRRLVDAGKMTREDVDSSWQSWRSYALHFDAWYTVRNMQNVYNHLFPVQKTS